MPIAERPDHADVWAVGAAAAEAVAEVAAAGGMNDRRDRKPRQLRRQPEPSRPKMTPNRRSRNSSDHQFPCGLDPLPFIVIRSYDTG